MIEMLDSLAAKKDELLAYNQELAEQLELKDREFAIIEKKLQDSLREAD